MSRFISYLNSAEKILSDYDGEIPFAPYIKNYFSKHKKYGSGDRKTITSICYSYFRVAHLFNRKPETGNLMAAVFLCSEKTFALIDNIRPDWSVHVQKSFEEKIKLLDLDESITSIFPWMDELDESIDKQIFCKALLHQPAFFIRIRPGKIEAVLHKLLAAGIAYEQRANDCLQLNAGVHIEAAITLDKEAVVQDYNSQQVLDFLKTFESLNYKQPVKIWDCCAASGGKSILAYDILQGKCQLTVSDIRTSIIHNLKKRLANAGIKHSSFITDLTKQVKLDEKYNIIICDAPCTGSGTWSRTPEQLYFFNQESINRYSELQKTICSNVIPHLQPGGLFIYITCSVFKKENQQVASFIEQQFQLKKIAEDNLYGYRQMADSMFVAVFKNTAS